MSEGKIGGGLGRITNLNYGDTPAYTSDLAAFGAAVKSPTLVWQHLQEAKRLRLGGFMAPRLVVFSTIY